MSLFVAELSHPEERGRLAVCLQLAALAVAGLLIAQTAPLLPWSRVPLERMVLQSAALTALAWLASAAVTLALYALCDHLFFQEWGAGEVSRAVLRTAATAVWFVPAIVLATTFHPGALVAALVLVHNVTRLLYWQWRVTQREEAQPLLEGERLFAAYSARAPLLLREMAPRLLVAICIQASVVAAIFHYYGLARALFYASTAMVTMLVMTVREYRPETGSSLWRSAAGLALSLMLAGGLTVGGLAPRARGGSGPDTGRDQAAGQPGTPVPGATRPDAIPLRDNENFPADSFPGVILWPEIQPVPTLIAPAPRLRQGGTGVALPPRPMSIPFSGEYWMYRWPFARPPHNSFLKRGNPAKLSFRTTDHRPLQMEARHKFDQPIDLRCCSQIQVAIRNADRQEGSTSLELVLMNTEVRPVLRQSLGVAPVMPAGEQAKGAVGVLQTLEFAIPAKSALDEFNEFQVIFVRDLQRMDKSAKIAIERFILVPR